MTNIPTDLLRTLIAVVDERSFTRAAQRLGVTQPAVSSQIKRLQAMLGSDLFDRSVPGLTLTAKGEVVVDHARRLLSINDLILDVAEHGPKRPTVRVGVPEEFLGGTFPNVLADCRKRWPDLRFTIRHGGLEHHLHDLRQGRIDIAVGLSLRDPPVKARHRWFEQAVWLRGPTTRLDPQAPVPLVSLREDWVCHRTAVDALRKSGRECELVLTAPTLLSLATAVGAGLGIMALVPSRVRSPDLKIWDEAPLPELPQLAWGIYLREAAERGPLEAISDSMAEILCRRAEAARMRKSNPVRAAVG